jgi:uncharacterized protein
MTHTSHLWRRSARLVGMALAVALFALPASAQQFDIPKPDGKENFVTDMAHILDSKAIEDINAMAAKLLNEKAVPLIVVTIPSMAAVGGPDMRIETFARFLFDDWGIGHPELEINGQRTSWNRGILLLVSDGDRKARIELGADWKHDQDALVKRIMDEQIVYHFKRGEFDTGIVAGVSALDKMARGLELPKRKRPWWHYALVVGTVVMAIWTVISLIRRGSGGWAWVFWGVIFGLIGMLLYQMFRNSGSGGGGFSGGSFGGGFSGGGGASGSW